MQEGSKDGGPFGRSRGRGEVEEKGKAQNPGPKDKPLGQRPFEIPHMEKVHNGEDEVGGQKGILKNVSPQSARVGRLYRVFCGVCRPLQCSLRVGLGATNQGGGLVLKFPRRAGIPLPQDLLKENKGQENWAALPAPGTLTEQS